MDSELHLVFGYVIASDNFGDAYVIPLRDALQDIAGELSAVDVCTTLAGDLLSYQKPKRNVIAGYPNLVNSTNATVGFGPYEIIRSKSETFT